MQVSIARQLGLQPTTVGNFFMNARRRLAHERYEQEAAAAVRERTGQVQGLLTNRSTVQPHNGLPAGGSTR